MGLAGRSSASFDSANLTANFQNMGNVINFPVRMMAVINKSDVDIIFDNLNDDFDEILIPANTTLSLGDLVNVNPSQLGLSIYPSGAQIQVKQSTAPGTGFLYITFAG